MRANIADYNAVVEAASKFTRSVAEGNSKYAKDLFTEDACLFGFLNGSYALGGHKHNILMRTAFYIYFLRALVKIERLKGC